MKTIKTRTILLTIGIVLLTLSVSAQDAMLTKEETINYLQKKLLEVEGREQIFEHNSIVVRNKYHTPSITMKGSSVKVTLFISNSEGEKPRFAIDEFNPAYIARVEVLKPKLDEGIGSVAILFDRRVVKRTDQFMFDGKPRDVGFVYIPYYATIPQNGERVMKALLHLRDLAKAEEDPFGN